MQKFFSQGVYQEKAAAKIAKFHDVLPEFNRSNLQVFFDIAIGVEGDEDYYRKRVVFELFSDVPKTCENFRGICTGDYGGRGMGLHYKGNNVHRVIKGFMMQAGDTTHGNGTGG